MVCTIAAGAGAEYYLSEQVEYYTGGKEPMGRWYALGGQFGLEDGAEVSAQSFMSLHGGKSLSGTALVKPTGALKVRVGAYDLTFSAPKSVSILWALGGEQVRTAIETAQQRAVRDALGLMDRHAVFGRRGSGGAEIEPVKLTAALFLHGDARPTGKGTSGLKSDPQLHTHAVVMNLAERADGTIGALDGRHLFRWKMAVGAVYRVALATELQSRLGIKTSHADAKGLFEIVGVPSEVIEHFSKRRDEILRKLGEAGLTSAESPTAAAKIAKSFRSSKEAIIEDRDAQLARWQEEARQLGFTQEVAAACCGHNTNAQAHAAGFNTRLSSALQKLTEINSTFQKKDIYVAVATAATGTGQTAIDVDRKVEELLQEEWIIALGSDALSQPVFTTRHQLQLEQDLQSKARQMARSATHALRAETVTRAVDGTALSKEQADAVRAGTQFADLAVIEGAAGSGKSYSLRTLSALYADAGYRVIGTATAWKTARTLGADCSLESRATDSWFATDSQGGRFLDNRTILIVDEAGQLSARQMHQILDSAGRAGAKVILTGDQKQLQAIGAGPGLRLVTEKIDATRIDTIRRQEQVWARDAATAFANGHAPQALEAYRQNNAIHLESGGEKTLRAAVDAWALDLRLHLNETHLVIARTNSEVESLSRLMRDRLQELGKLDRDGAALWSTDGKPLLLAKGDQIRFTRRIAEIDVVNGTTAAVVSIQTDAKQTSSATLFIEGQVRTVLLSQIADAKGRLPLKYNYASTLYAAQGATVDRAYLVASPRLKRNELYVGVSRARKMTQLFVDREQAVRMELDSRPLDSRQGIELSDAVIFSRLGKAWSAAFEKVSALDHVANTTHAARSDQKSIPTQESELLF